MEDNCQEVSKSKKSNIVNGGHIREDTSGHTLHYDYVVDLGKIPRHPIVSSIFFVSANCGNATLFLIKHEE